MTSLGDLSSFNEKVSSSPYKKNEFYEELKKCLNICEKSI